MLGDSVFSVYTLSLPSGSGEAHHKGEKCFVVEANVTPGREFTIPKLKEGSVSSNGI